MFSFSRRLQSRTCCQWLVSFLSLSCGLFFLFNATLIESATLTNMTSRQTIQNQLNALSNRSNLTAHETLALSDYKKAIQFYDELAGLEKQAELMQKRVMQAPREARYALDNLARIKREQQQSEQTKTKYQHLSLSQLENQLKNKLEILQNQQENLANINNNLVALQTQPERAMNIMLENTRRLQDIRYQLNNDFSSNDDIRPSLQVLLQVKQLYLQQQNKFQQHALQANTQLQDVLQKQRDYTATYLELIQSDIQYIQATINNKRLNYSEETAKEAQRSTINSQEVEEYPVIKHEKAINKALSERLISVTQDSNQLVQKGIRIKSWLERAIQVESNLKEQITVLRGSLLLSRILFQKQINLPPNILTKNLPTLIADLRLEQFDINQERDKLYQSSNYINKLADTINDSMVDKTKTMILSKEVWRALESLIDIRRDLLDQLNIQLGNHISQAINLQLDQQQLLGVIDSLEQTLAQQIFWVNSNKPIDLTWLTSFPDAAKAEITTFNFKLPLVSIVKGLINSSVVTIPLLLACLFFFWMNRKFKQRLKEINEEVRVFKKDSQLHTPVALILTLMMTFPGAFIVLVIGYWFLKTGNPHGDFIWSFALQLALFWVLFSWCINILKPDSIAENHFLIAKKENTWLRQHLINLMLPLIVLIYWSSYGVMYPLRLADDVIGQLIVLIFLFLVFLFTLPFCRRIWQLKGGHLTRTIVITILAFSPLVLIGLMMVGYYYTTLRLSSRWIDSLYLLLLWYIIYHSCIRGLSIAARKLAYKRALERRHNMTREEQENEPITEPPMSIELISQQSLRLSSMVLFLIFIVAFYWIWSDFITIFSFLDGIQLWHTNVQNEAGHTLQAVTLADLILAIIIFIVALVMTRNLPGLLEVLVLSRLKLRQGSSYAITTMLTYIIIGIGTIIVLAMLGVTWNKLQWLAAALTFGLGFGLQEIFANFVSGIIILFERPVRIGDTVTIGNFSGTVSKIRIRATTITDFDRKEVIIPNKAFVTERLINWSLTDTITRIIIKLGVAYGSDLDKVKAILLQAAQSNNKIMSDPAPLVFFTDFGDSTLNHELRFYVRQIADRSTTLDEVNRLIDRLCREENINIAFNQLEVHLHNSKGDSVQEVERTLGDEKRSKQQDKNNGDNVAE
ncbi:mechanosensitive channel MscK [Arsenophonus endosymbiont of Bemisia tabaci]|uniref:mechanosensitive channel MscK n=1 Tax=Arsenophonus endosymbiont of Bemisia tabaci TaxID=536059 RepID=UPI0015F4BEBF|nr:Mechanosensitive channel MscK [Arsenophonus endosymbiont of Bemisia tabaci Q2]